MTDISTNERVLRSSVTMDESKKIEKVLRENNISYYEKWNTHKGLLSFLNNGKNAKCDIYIHKDALEAAEKALGKDA